MTPEEIEGVAALAQGRKLFGGETETDEHFLARWRGFSSSDKAYVLEVFKEPEAVPETALEGAKAIIGLQAMAGLEETPEEALAGWQWMSAREKEFTLEMWGKMRPKK